MPNTHAVPASLPGPLKKLCRFSVSYNIFRSLVKPLVTDLYGDDANYRNTSSILDLLVETHKCFWHAQGQPLEFPGAVAGHFQELIFAFKKAEKGDDQRTVKVGAEGPPAGPKVGGDVWQVFADGRTKTYQFKVANAAGRNFIKEHINKAGAQLTGQTGEVPQAGSENIIYMIVQNTVAFGAYQANDWKLLVEEALDEDYVSDRGGGARAPRVVAKADIKAVVNKIKILTRNSRFRFTNQNGAVEFTNEEAVSMDEAKFFTFSDGRFQQHWDWLRNTWWPQNVNVLANKDAIITQTKLNGIAANNAFQTLPHRTQA